MADNFFDDESIKEAVKAVRAANKRMSPGGRILPPVTQPPRPEEAKRAAELFNLVASGALPVKGTGPERPGYSPPPRPAYVRPDTRWVSSDIVGQRGSITPEKGLEAILNAINAAGSDEDVLRAASEWMTRVTNSIYDTIREITERAE